MSGIVTDGLNTREKLERVLGALDYVYHGGHVIPEDRMQMAICMDVLEEVIAELRED